MSSKIRGGVPIVNEDKLKEYQSWQLDSRGMVPDDIRNAFFKVLRSKVVLLFSSYYSHHLCFHPLSRLIEPVLTA